MSKYSAYNEVDLIVFLRSGDHVAFTEIYNRYWDTLIDAAYQRLKRKEDAEEVVQEIFVNLYIRRLEINPKTTLEAYLKTALKYKVIDAYRAQQLHYKHLDSLIKASHVATPKPNELLEIKELRNKVYQAADKLPEKCREVFLMSRFEELTNPEIAARLNISVATVKSHLNKALKILRTEFGNQFELLAFCFFIFSY